MQIKTVERCSTTGQHKYTEEKKLSTEIKADMNTLEDREH